MRTEREQIDRIVREVLSRLSASAAAYQSNGHQPSPPDRVIFTETVITGDMLSERGAADQAVDIGEAAILTPTARDWIRSRNITVRRVTKHRNNTIQQTKHDTAVVVVNSTSVLEELLADAGLSPQSFDCPDDAAESAAERITSGIAGQAVVFAVWCHRAAMLANRHAKVRAAVIHEIPDVRRIAKQMKPNVWCLDPTDRGYIELRNLHRQIAAS